jgi:hypothetical protein
VGVRWDHTREVIEYWRCVDLLVTDMKLLSTSECWVSLGLAKGAGALTVFQYT